MLRRVCKLCQLTKTPSHTLRTFSTTLKFGQSDSTIPAITFCEDDEADATVQEIKDIPPVIEDSRPLIIGSKRREFNFYKGQTFLKSRQIPIASQGWQHYKSKGDYFTIYPDLEEDDYEDYQDNITFASLGLSPEVQKIVQRLGLTEPTHIQQKAIPNILSGENTVIQAETGTGKTFTYLLPIVDQVLRWKPLLERSGNSPLALILVPSRELVIQVGHEAKMLCKDLDIDIKILTSDKTKKVMRNPPVENVDVLIGTVGVTSKMTTTHIYKLNEVRHTVLDEAHALFDKSYDEKLSIFLQRINFGFKQSIAVNSTPGSSQLTMVSATMPNEVPQYLDKCINRKSLVPIQSKNIHRVLVPQKFWRMGLNQKPHNLLKIVKPRALCKEGTVIFCNSTATAYWISIFFSQMNINAAALTGDQQTELRKKKYWDFRTGKTHILSTTNSFSRGLNTITVDCVINYDFPMDTADYIHRCGRTGRVGSKTDGKVINFISRPLEIDLAMKIERAARKGRALPIFNIYDQNVEKEMSAELKELLGSIPKEQNINFPNKSM